MDLLPIRRALLSVTDKTNLVPFAEFLVQGGTSLVSTGGTFNTLKNAGLPVTQVSEVTGFPEIMAAGSKPCTPKFTAVSWRTRTIPRTWPHLRNMRSSPLISSA